MVRSSWQREMKMRAGSEKLPTNVFIPFASTSLMMLNLQKFRFNEESLSLVFRGRGRGEQRRGCVGNVASFRSIEPRFESQHGRENNLFAAQ
jgi:hypothetical protein